MNTDMENLEINQLEEITKQALALIEKKQREKVDQAYDQILAIAEEIGMSLEDLIAYGENRPQSTEKRTVAPRYRNPKDQSQVWTGRGKKPRWVVDALEAGSALEDLLIK